MMGKINDLLHLSEQVKALQTTFEDLDHILKTHSESIEGMRSELVGLKETQSKVVDQLKGDAKDFSALKDDLKKEIVDFKILKSKLETSIINSFEEQLKTELLPKFNRLESHVKKFDELGEGVRLVNSRVAKLSEELQKFQDISQSIKKVDFDLVNAAKQLKSQDDEKLALMRKIDSMERLVSKMRRH